MEVRTPAQYVGRKLGETSKAKVPYADILVNLIGTDGTPDIEQTKIRSYDPAIIAQTGMLHAGDTVILELYVKEASLTGIELPEEE